MSNDETKTQIRDYIYKRLVYLISMTENTEYFYNELFSHDNIDMEKLIESLYEFITKTEHCLTISVYDNVLKFINRKEIRFNREIDYGKTNKYINDIIGVCNTANRDNLIDYTFFVEERIKFFGIKGAFTDLDNFAELYNLEQQIFIFLSNILSMDEEEFYSKQLINDTDNKNILFVINYLLDDFPLIFKNKVFDERVNNILSTNKSMYNDKNYINYMNKVYKNDKVKIKELKQFVKHNDKVLKKYNRI